MIERNEIENVLSDYDQENLTIGVLCSHSALQLVHGAKREGFRTLGVCVKERESTYKAFPLARPDDFLILDQFDDILEAEHQETMRERNAIVLPHGSFVEYVGPKNLLEKFRVPMFGNRESLEWEGDRKKQREWLERAGVKVPHTYERSSEIDERVFVKFPGAKGGRGSFIASSREDFEKKLEEKIREGEIRKDDAERVSIQKFVPGIRYYPHYFYSLFDRRGMEAGEGAIELLGMDRRIEPIDESYRGLPDVPQEFFDYTVTGNEPLIVREKLLVDLMNMAAGVVETSLELFPPGMVGPFCLETIYHPDEGFIAFEISGRIVAGTNLFPEGSPYSYYFFEEPMSTGRRIAREIKDGVEKNRLHEVVY